MMLVQFLLSTEVGEGGGLSQKSGAIGSTVAGIARQVLPPRSMIPDKFEARRASAGWRFWTRRWFCEFSCSILTYDRDAKIGGS